MKHTCKYAQPRHDDADRYMWRAHLNTQPPLDGLTHSPIFNHVRAYRVYVQQIVANLSEN